MPAEWGGRQKDFAKISGVPDALYCHNACFLAEADSLLKERRNLLLLLWVIDFLVITQLLIKRYSMKSLLGITASQLFFPASAWVFSKISLTLATSSSFENGLVK